jgi:hypothetical protein
VLALEISLPLAASAGAESIALPSRPRRCRDRSRCRRAAWIDGKRWVRERAIESATESRWVALGRANQALAFSWKRKTDDRRADMALRFQHACPRRSVSVRRCHRSRRWCASKCCKASLAKSRWRSPGVVVNQVNGATVADWEARNGLLRVRLLDPVATELSFVVRRKPASCRRRHQRAARAGAGG